MRPRIRNSVSTFECADAQEAEPAGQALHALRLVIHLAQKVGAGLGCGEVLLGTLSQTRQAGQGTAWRGALSTVLFWFRSDLRLHDQPALRAACESGATHLVPVYCHADYEAQTLWGFARVGVHRRAVLAAALRDLSRQLVDLGNRLVECYGPPGKVLPALAHAVGASAVFCEDIAAPYEQADVAEVRSAGLHVQTVWQSSLIDPLALPWPVQSLPAVFTTFRQALEQARIAPSTPLPPPTHLPPWPSGVIIPPGLLRAPAHVANETLSADSRTSFPYGTPEFDGGETAGLRHLARYLQRKLPHTYKRTRNALAGLDFSSKWSPWLATGALSPRRVMAELQQFEQSHGQSDGSYWLWFELLWRDYFRFLHLKHGSRLYRARGLADVRQHAERRDVQGFERWRHASTGEPLVDAAMRELDTTGYLSNRLRQVVASYLVHELGGDWRAGAAWFESQLVDYDVYSNQGNWLYIAGRGTDPRGGRRFNVRKQASEYDPDGSYLHLWAAR